MAEDRPVPERAASRLPEEQDHVGNFLSGLACRYFSEGVAHPHRRIRPRHRTGKTRARRRAKNDPVGFFVRLPCHDHFRLVLFKSLSQTGAAPAWHPDPARLAAGALSGTGFLGAGVIIRQTNHLIRGVTTAATLWFSTVIGLAFGAGALGIGILGAVLAFLILFFLPALESHIQDDWYSDFSVYLQGSSMKIEAFLAELNALDLRVKGLDFQTDRENSLQQITFHLKYKKGDLVRIPLELTERIGKLPGVVRTHWHST
jgi:uncharacterized membrane protein YhiD involved in acid resistance